MYVGRRLLFRNRSIFRLGRSAPDGLLRDGSAQMALLSGHSAEQPAAGQGLPDD